MRFLLFSFLFIFSITSFANKALSTKEIKDLIRPSFASTMHITAEPELIAELNHMLSNDEAYKDLQSTFERMQEYRSTIQSELNSRHIPYDLFAMPIVQSGFKPLPQSANSAKAAGIWQIVPDTAETLGLSISPAKDERLNTRLATKAALDYLQTLFKQFKDWKLAVVAYEIGEEQTAALIQKTGSRNAWVIAKSNTIPKNKQKELLSYLAKFDATVIILHNQQLIKS